jgi:UDP-glucose 4-epimerase
MNVLVTGGAGFIGSHLVDRLLAEGHTVRVLDNCDTGSEANLDAARRAYPPAGEQSRFRFLGGSVLADDMVAAAVDGCDLVFHLAAAVGVMHVIDDPLWAIVTNTRGTENVLKRAHAAGARVVFASTSEVYGQSEDVPFREEGQRVLGPTWTHRWCYSTSKALDEHLCFAYWEKGLEVSIVRYFNIFGTRMHPDGYGSVIARFVTQARAGVPITVHGDGLQTRTFTHVTDAVEATLRCGQMGQALGQAFNVGGRNEVSVLDLAEMIKRLAASDSTITFVPYDEAFGPGFADTRRRVPNIDKAKRLLGWEPTVTLEDGLREILSDGSGE